MNGKKLIAVLGIAALACSPALAQQQPQQQQQGPPGTGVPKPKKKRPNYGGGRVTRKHMLALPTGLFLQMKNRLKLDQNQAPPIEQLAKEYDEKLLQIRQEYIDRCREYLTAEQQAELDKMLKYDNWTRNKPKGVDMVRRNPWMFRILAKMFQFSDQQKEQIEVILKQYQPQRQALSGDDAALTQLSEATFNQIMTLLTPEQQQKVMDFQKDRQGRQGQQGNQ